MTADATPPDGPTAPGTATRREAVDLPVVPPAVARATVESDGRVGAVAYPYSVYEATVTVSSRLLPDREMTYVASVDRSRRLVVRADAVPDVETRRIEDVLVVPDELSDAAVHEKAETSVFDWTLRKFALGDTPDVDLAPAVDAYKLFWLASRPDGDVIVDSASGEESPLVE